MPHPVYTIGHSNDELDAFLQRLRRHGIELVVDVRSNPCSRWAWFRREALERSLGEAEIAYRWLGRELGPRREEEAPRVEGRVPYEEVARLPLFREGIASVLASASHRRTALLCAEREPLDCHRTLLVGRRLAERGADVVHILPDGGLEEHAAAMERLVRTTGVEPDLFAGGGREELIARACRAREERITSRRR